MNGVERMQGLRDKYQRSDSAIQGPLVTVASFIFQDIVEVLKRNLLTLPDLETELLVLFKPEDSNFIDDCIRLALLSEFVIRTAAQDQDGVEKRAATCIRQVLIKNQPYFCFLPAFREVVPGDFRCFGSKASQITPENPDQALFRWICTNKEHHNEAIDRLNIREPRSPSFYIAIRLGDYDAVEYMLQCMEDYLNTNLSTVGLSSTRIFFDIFGLAHPNYGTPLEHTAQYYDPTKLSSLLQNRLKIIQHLITRQPDIVMRDTMFNNHDPGNPRNDETFQTAIRTRKWDIVKKIIEFAPAKFFEEQTITKALRELQSKMKTEKEIVPWENGAQLLLDLWCDKNEMTLGIAGVIIELDQMNFWKRESVLLSLRNLGNNASITRGLLDIAFKFNRPKFVQEILALFPTNTFGADEAAALVNGGLLEIWKLEPIACAWERLQSEDTNLSYKLLVCAIERKKKDFVQILLDGNESLAQRLSEVPGPYKSLSNAEELMIYPLWHNNCIFREDGKGWEERSDKGDPERRAIRNALVRACIRGSDNMQKLCHIFRSSHETVADICLDLSYFNSTHFPLDLFAKSLPRRLEPDTQSSHRYEPTLRYATFPVLGPDSDEDWRNQELQDHEEVFQILNWLHDENHVEEIVHLYVPDRVFNPHDEHNIADLVHKFQVQILDWRYLDLAISTFEDGRGDSIQVIHLYSSGKRAAMTHWFSAEGILRLPKLKEARIHLIKESMSNKQREKTIELLKTLIKSLKKPGPNCTFTIDSWHTQPISEKSTLSDIAERAVPKLWSFIKDYRNYVLNKVARDEQLRSAKIAIIDNGIMNIVPLKHDTQSQGPQIHSTKQETENQRNKPSYYQAGVHRIVFGNSFVDDNRTMGSWSFPSDPHGTQMMNLICAIDPCCEVYVAKVVEGRYGIVPERLARAIHWAIQQEVDVISMSLATYEEHDGVIEAVREADSKGILVLCSVHDEGLNIEKAWPASLKETITFAASNRVGQVTQNMPADAYDFHIHATNIFAGVVPFMHFDEFVSGSSVATAIGAGLSSLIISCCYLANRNRTRNGSKWRKDEVERWLKKMAPRKDDLRYVQLEMFCEIAKRATEGSSMDFETILAKYFSD